MIESQLSALQAKSTLEQLRQQQAALQLSSVSVKDQADYESALARQRDERMRASHGDLAGLGPPPRSKGSKRDSKHRHRSKHRSKEEEERWERKQRRHARREGAAGAGGGVGAQQQQQTPPPHTSK
jgi:hypothetical protein